MLLALLGELLLCAEEGDILRKDTVTKYGGSEPERAVVAEAMRLLRNAVCHPASATEHDDEKTGVVSFADFVNKNFREETWASALRARPGDLAKREVAVFALQLVDALGWARAQKWGLRMKGAKRPHSR